MAKTAIELLRERLQCFEKELAITADAAKKFELRTLIEETKSEIAKSESKSVDSGGQDQTNWLIMFLDKLVWPTVGIALLCVTVIAVLIGPALFQGEGRALQKLEPVLAGAEMKGRTVIAIRLKNSANNDHLRHLSAFPSLQRLDLSGCKNVSDLQNVSKLPALEELILSHTNVGDDQLKCVGTLKNLRRLEINDTKVTHEGLEHLTDLTKLEVVVARQTQISSDGSRSTHYQLVIDR